MKVTKITLIVVKIISEAETEGAEEDMIGVDTGEVEGDLEAVVTGMAAVEEEDLEKWANEALQEAAPLQDLAVQK